jgi:hypothetical protein
LGLLRLGEQHGKRDDRDNSAVVENKIANDKRADDSNPKLAGLVRNVDERFSELRINVQSAIQFDQSV